MKAEEQQFIDEDPEAVVDQYESEGLDEAVHYNLGVAEDSGIDTRDWSNARLKEAILAAAKAAGRLRPEDRSR